MDTIACISTPLGKGAISIVRMSGQDSLKIAQKVFSSSKLDYKKITPRFLYLGDFKIEDLKEKCLMVFFKSPYSYTGEDLVEFQIHGGTIITEKVLEILLKNGARLAEPGELTRRAFENGKISLDEAESVIEEINAESENALKASLKTSEVKVAVIEMQNEITELLAQIEATLDYPEEDFEDDVKESIMQTIKQIKQKLIKILTNSENARYINAGINITIAGSPNVGKSSLLNAILGRERAIVTDIKGTTRDAISESIYYKGIKFIFTDTAGIRETKNEIEKLGVEKSKDLLEKADIILFVVDGSLPFSKEDKYIYGEVKDKKHIVVINKGDKPRKIEHFDNEIMISALKKQNIEKLLETIYNDVITQEIDFNSYVVTNERQIEILKKAQGVTETILNEKTSMDVIAMLIKELWNTLGKITGQCENEQIIDLIFSKFCLGK